MSDRPCIRGCVQRGVHYAQCHWYGVAEEMKPVLLALPNAAPACAGCAPVEARDGMLLCDRCFRQLRHHLEDAPDLLAHLRSLVDPMKAAVYDKVMVSSSRKELPAPVPADLIDASSDIARMLFDWAAFVDPVLAGRPSILSRSATEVVFDDADWHAMVILAYLGVLANRVEVRDLADAVLHRHGGEPEWWSVADAAARYPLADRPRYATSPCPECDTKSVWVQPPRRIGQTFRYTCRSCGWEANDQDDDGLWGDVFSGPAVAATEERKTA